MTVFAIFLYVACEDHQVEIRTSTPTVLHICILFILLFV